MNPNPRFTLAARLVNHTGRHLFLTGRAGTGKTTFLRYIQQTTPKKTVVVAPTGVAAINAGGVTMHSFFQLPLGMYLPDARLGFSASDEEGATGRLVVNRHTLFKNIRFNKDKIALLRELELLVIDEVSMLRADALDAIDAILRHFRRRQYEPFGGVQVLFIGDLYQLPPVVSQTEAPLMAEHYRSHFFFGARVLQDEPPLVLELDTIYRQSDAAFITLLNNIRSNSITEEDIQLLQPHYQPHRHPTEGYITLTTHNAKADDINRRALEHLPGAVRRYEGVLTGDFPEKALPAERELGLKLGAQIMFIVNDKGEQRRFFNGKLATVVRITEEEEIWVKLSGEETELKLERFTWKNIRYKYNDAQDDIEEEDMGSYSQYPVRLAWAITIHKSQGLTFERAVVDAGQAFAPGQVYVALSRLTALDGLILHSRLSQQGIHMPDDVVEFCAKTPGTDRLERIVEEAERRYASQQLVKWFSVERLIDAAEANHLEYNHRNIPDAPVAVQWSQSFREAAARLSGPSAGFMQQLEGLLRAAGAEGYDAVRDRVEAAAKWFTGQIDTVLLPSLKEHFGQWKSKSRSKKYLADLGSLEAALLTLRKNIGQAVQLAAGLAGGSALHEIDLKGEVPQSSLEQPEKGAKAVKGESSGTSLRMFREGKGIDEIAAERGLAASTVEGHLSDHILTGEVAVNELVPPAQQSLIAEAIAAFGAEVPASTTAIKEKLPAEISHAAVRAVLNHQRFLNGAQATA